MRQHGRSNMADSPISNPRRFPSGHSSAHLLGKWSKSLFYEWERCRESCARTENYPNIDLPSLSERWLRQNIVIQGSATVSHLECIEQRMETQAQWHCSSRSSRGEKLRSKSIRASTKRRILLFAAIIAYSEGCNQLWSDSYHWGSHIRYVQGSLWQSWPSWEWPTMAQHNAGSSFV